MEISMNKKYKTREGREVVLYTTEVPGRFSVHGSVLSKEGKWDVCAWTEEGRSFVNWATQQIDLIEAPEEIEKVEAPVEIEKLRVSVDKKYQTRGGREVIIYETEVPGEFPVYGRVFADNGGWSPCIWTEYGRVFNDGTPHVYDLIEVKEEMKMWINIYSPGNKVDHRPMAVTAYPTKEEADEMGACDRIACVKVTFKEGDGL